MPFTIVHRKTAVVPTGRPITLEVAEWILVTVAIPLSTVQVPVPTLTRLPVRVKLPLLHWVWSTPATAVGAVISSVTTKASESEHPVAVLVTVSL